MFYKYLTGPQPNTGHLNTTIILIYRNQATYRHRTCAQRQPRSESARVFKPSAYRVGAALPCFRQHDDTHVCRQLRLIGRRLTVMTVQSSKIRYNVMYSKICIVSNRNAKQPRAGRSWRPPKLPGLRLRNWPRQEADPEFTRFLGCLLYKSYCSWGGPQACGGRRLALPTQTFTGAFARRAGALSWALDVRDQSLELT